MIYYAVYHEEENRRYEHDDTGYSTLFRPSPLESEEEWSESGDPHEHWHIMKIDMTTAVAELYDDGYHSLQEARYYLPEPEGELAPMT